MCNSVGRAVAVVPLGKRIVERLDRLVVQECWSNPLLDIGVSFETPGGPSELFGWTVITLFGSHLRSSRMAPGVSAPVAVTRGGE